MNRELQAYETIECHLDRDWLTIWLNCPESRNALSAVMSGELLDVLNLCADDRTIRGVTLRGRNGIFCSGADLKGFRTATQSGATAREETARINRGGGRLFERINSLPQVVVVLVEGAAMGGGLGMVCCADVVGVCADAKFALTETTLGIPPAQIAPFVADRLGLRTARRLMLTGARFNGSDSLALGLADYVAADAVALDAIEQEIRKQVRRCAPGANAVTKDLLLASRRLERDAMLDKAAAAFAGCVWSEEGREGIASFLEKRRPAWAEPDANAAP